ncbi:MAG: chain length determinant protein EpsF [Gammaproteobacteria bacterium]
MSAKQLIESLLGRKRLFGAVLLATVTIVIVASLLWPKTYISEASVVVDSKSTDPVSGLPQSPEMLPSTIATQVDIISSHSVALKVVRRLHLSSNPTYKQKYESATNGKGPIDDWVADYLLNKVYVTPSHDSHVINIDVGAFDSELSATLANAFADAYIQTSLELKADPARRQGEWFAQQLKSLRSSLEAAQTKMSDFQRNSGVVGTNDQIDIENTRLAELSTQLIAAQSTMYETQNKLKQMTRATQLDKLDEMPDLSSNVLLQNLKADLVRAQGKLAETAARFGNNHPEYVSADAMVKALQRKLAAQIATAAGTIRQSAELSSRQQAEIQHALDQQRDRVLQLKHAKDKLDIMRRDVDSAQQAYDAGLQRASQVHLESQLDQSNIAILNSAVAPLFPAKPKIFLNALISFVVGIILGLAIVISVERGDQRIRAGDALMDMTGVALLSEIPRHDYKQRSWRGSATMKRRFLIKPQRA